MTVKFKFDYVLNLHNKNTYILAIERDGDKEEVAYKRSLVQINRLNIKSINKSPDGGAIIIMKTNTPPLTTVEDYNEIIDTMQRSNTALEIMQRDKIYIFDNFEVDSDELGVIEGWDKLEEETKTKSTKKKKK